MLPIAKEHNKMSEAKTHNPDLQKERDGATIDTEELSCLIYNGPEELSKRRKLGM